MLKILLIDDDKTTLFVTKAMLKKHLKEIEIEDSLSVSNYMDIDFSQYSLVVCDENLGEKSISGIEFLKNINFDIKKILLTGDDSIAMQIKMFANPNISYVQKNLNHGDNSTISLLVRLIREATDAE